MLIGGVEEMAKIRLDPYCVEVVPASFLDPGAGWTSSGIEPHRSDVISHQTIEAAIAAP